MSFYTALTGLNAATAQLDVTSNNIANVATVGFKRSRTDFGDIFATSPLQKASATIGQGVSLKGVTQEFSQGNLSFTSNTLDMAISGSGFFPLKSKDGFQDIFTRNGVFMMNDQNNVVNAAGQKLMAASVDSSGKANLSDMNVLTIQPKTIGMAKQTSQIQLGLNFPADAAVITKPFDRTDPTTYNKSTAVTVYDAGGNAYLATVYYVKTQNASQASPNNKWQTYVYIGDKLVTASLQQATNSAGDLMYVNKYGQLKAKSDFITPQDQAALMSSFAQKTEKFSLNSLTNVQTSQPASITGGSATSLGTGINDGLDMSTYTPISKVDLLGKQGSDSVVYDLNTAVTADAYTIGYGGAAPITVATSGTTPPSLNEVVETLNSDAGFASKFVAQATTTVTISNLLTTSTADLKDLKITIDGKQTIIGNLHSASTNLGDIASALQQRLRSTDGERANFSVNESDNGRDLVITDSQGREISGVQLELSDNAIQGGVASAGTVTPSDATAKLQIASIDPNVSDDSMLSAISINKQVSGVTTTITGSGIANDASRVTANYDLSAPATSYTVTLGTDANAPVVTSATNGALADALNANTTFAASYQANWDDASKTLSITSLDPSKTYNAVSGALSVASINGGTSTTVSAAERTAALFNTQNAYNDGASITLSMDGSPLTLTPAPTSTNGLVAALNANTTFNASYTASLNNGNLKIMAHSLAATESDIASHFAIVSTSTAPDITQFPVSTTAGTSSTPGTATVTFGALSAGQSITLGGLTYTSIGNSSAADIASAFANVSDGGSSSSYKGVFSGALTGFSSGVANAGAGQATFTSTALNTTPNLGEAVAQASYSASSVGAGNPISAAYAGLKSADELKDLFQINVDGSINPVTVSLDRLAGQNMTLSGAQIAQEINNEINRAYGGEKPYNFAGTSDPTFTLQLNVASDATTHQLDIKLANSGDANHNMHEEDLVDAVQSQIDSDPTFAGKVTVSYDTQLQDLVFTPTNASDKMTVLSSSNALNITAPIVQGVNDASVSLDLTPSLSTSPYRAVNDQRYGINVQYDSIKDAFVFSSGTTGDISSISISNIKPDSLATQTVKGLGLTGDPSTYAVAPSPVNAMRGVVSQPAVLTGNAMSVNVDNNFAVDSTNNQFVVSVNGVTGTVTIPPKDNYTIDTFTHALQDGINSLQGPATNGLSPQTVNGVQVSYDTTQNALVFTTGTATNDTYIKVTGNTKWGLDNLNAQFGKTSTWIKLTQSVDSSGAPVFIDNLGKETTSASGFNGLPAWSPVYFDKGELTFDTAGNLVSPKQGAQLDTVYLPNGNGALTINIDYSKSTQYASPFSVLSQSQDGAPEGDLVSLAIQNDGLVQASYSNGAQKSLGKVVLVNFSNPSGLKQIGDTNYYSTSDSGTPKYGEAGSAGFGTVQSGATEGANVDLTQELVDLITEQRNFQASAKAIETDTQLTQTIIQIHN